MAHGYAVWAALLETAGFELLRNEVVAEHEPERGVLFQSVRARA